jgi:hypothetical protein
MLASTIALGWACLVLVDIRICAASGAVPSVLERALTCSTIRVAVRETC